MQGFSAGGEWGGAAAFLVEYAPAGRRGYIGSWQQFSVGLRAAARLAARDPAVRDAGTRGDGSVGVAGPFLVGILIAGFAIYYRLRLPDTPEFEAAERSDSIAPNSAA